MNNWSQILALGITLLLLSGCDSSSSEKDDTIRPKVFFDLATYFKEEISRLSDLNPKVRKIANLNGEEEIVDNAEIDFESELDVFVRSDINKLSWIDKYKGDTLFNNGVISKITYKLIDEGLRTKFVEVVLEEGEVQSVSIENSAENIVVTSSQSLSYRPEFGFSITHEQDLLLGKNSNVSIEIKY